MSIKRSKPVIMMLDCFLFLVFLIPIAFERLFRKRIEGSVKKILILELWGIGDLILMSSVIRPLRAFYPNAIITLLAKNHAHALWCQNSVVDQVVEVDCPWTHFKGKYRFWEPSWQRRDRLTDESLRFYKTQFPPGQRRYRPELRHRCATDPIQVCRRQRTSTPCSRQTEMPWESP